MFNRPLFKALALNLILLFAASGPSVAYDIQWPQPTPPPGANLAAFPAPRLDWLGHFLNNLSASKGKQIDLIFDGDSITDFWMTTGRKIWNDHYAPLNAFDFGISGDQVQHVLWRVQNGQVDGLKPKLVVLMIGTNNMPSPIFSPDQIAEGVKVLVQGYEKQCPDAHILLLGIFPRGEHPNDPLRAKITATNQILATFDDGKKVTYLDFGAKLLQTDGTMTRVIMPDFLHPSPAGYQIWADAIQPVIDQYLRK